jgi:hypothetical protein
MVDQHYNAYTCIVHCRETWTNIRSPVYLQLRGNRNQLVVVAGLATEWKRYRFERWHSWDSKVTSLNCWDSVPRREKDYCHRHVQFLSLISSGGVLPPGCTDRNSKFFVHLLTAVCALIVSCFMPTSSPDRAQQTCGKLYIVLYRLGILYTLARKTHIILKLVAYQNMK